VRITWSDDLSVGFKAIDDQHKTLINIINKFQDALLNGEGPESIQSVVKFIEIYTKVHFSTEEKYMEGFKYPNAEHHKEEHRKLIEFINHFKNKVMENPNNHKLALELNENLKNWYINHINKIDKHLGAFLKMKKEERNSYIEEKINKKAP